MRALRFIKHPVKNKIIIILPESYGNEDVEVTVKQLKKKGLKRTSEVDKFCGFMKNIEMDTKEEIRKMRNEWERNIY